MLFLLLVSLFVIGISSGYGAASAIRYWFSLIERPVPSPAKLVVLFYPLLAVLATMAHLSHLKDDGVGSALYGSLYLYCFTTYIFLSPQKPGKENRRS